MSIVSAIGEAVGITKHSIRGLSTFISDIRNCPNKDEEEKRVNREMAHIRKQFKDNPKLDGYSRKKYVAKILYMYILGYEPDFGYTEALRLLSSKKFQEKQIGYLTLSVVLNEDHEMIPLVINSFKTDLEARPEQHISLALATICNIGGKTMAEALLPDVEKLLISQASDAMVRKKAAMCMLRLFQRYPDLFQPEVWKGRAKEMLAEENAGVLTSYISFFTYAANTTPSTFQPLYRTMLKLLARAVSGGKTPEQYLYYRVPTPWLSVKLMRWLQLYDLPDNDEESKYFIDLLGKVLAGADLVIDQQGSSRNAFHMVLMEAINTVIHLQKTPELMEKAANILSGFLQDKSSNLRYLALDAFTKLAQLSVAASNIVKKHQDTVTASLQDADISIRRRALDLVYGMCDKKNCKGIVNELLIFLNYLNVNIPNDFAIREELVLKIAILAEKFASQYKWYVDVMLQMMTAAGDVMSDDIWFRCIKMIMNHDDIQAYATETAFKALKEPNCNPTMVKVGTFLLGEYGHLIYETVSAQTQYSTLVQKFQLSSDTIKAIILSTFLKMAAHYPEIRQSVSNIYSSYSSQINPELQQRAVEYLQILSQQPQLLPKVTEALPSYADMGDQEEVLEVKPSKASGDVPTRQPSAFSQAINAASPAGPSSSTSAPTSPIRDVISKDQVDGDVSSPMSDSEATVTTKKGKKKSNKKKHHKGVWGDDGQTEAVNEEFAETTGATKSATNGNANGKAAPQLSLAPPPQTTPSNLSTEEQVAANFKRLCLIGSGVLYEDNLIQVGIKSEFQKGLGRVMIYFGNKSPYPFSNMTATIPPTSFITTHISEELSSNIDSASQQRLGLALQCLTPFSQNSLLQLSITFLCNGKNFHHKWDLPFTLTRFMDPAPIDPTKFMNSWSSVTQPSNSSVEILNSLHPVNVPAISQVVEMGLRLKVLEGVDKNTNNITAAGVFTCAQGTSFALARIETNAEAQMMRVTIKASNTAVTAALREIFATSLGKPQTTPTPTTQAAPATQSVTPTPVSAASQTGNISIL